MVGDYENKSKRDNRHIILISVIILIIVVGCWFLNYFTLLHKTESARGTFGDMFGAVNALFSGLAFGGIIITILLQRKELALQHQELKDTRKELERSADAQTAQHVTLMSQQYQTTFFNLLSGHNALIDSINFENSAVSGYKGLAIFEGTVQDFTETYGDSIKKQHFDKSDDTRKNPVYLLEENRHFFDSLFGDLITIIKIIDGLLKDDLYYEILYNHLTTSEKYLIGLYLDCNEDEYSRLIGTHRYNFNKYYQKQRYRYKLSTDTYFPAITITRKRNSGQPLLSNIFPASELFDFNIFIDRQWIDGNLILKQVKLSAFNNDPYGSMILLFTKVVDDISEDGIVITGKTEMHLMPYVYESFRKHLVKFMILYFDFTFLFGVKHYNVKYEVGVVADDVNASHGSKHGIVIDKKLSFTVDR